jgi:hypothetical protein
VVRLDRFRVGESDIALTMALRDGVYQTRVTGQRLDLRPILGDTSLGDDEAASSGGEVEAEEKPLGVAVDIDAAIDTVLFPKTPQVSEFRGLIGHDGTRVTRMDLTGKIGVEPVWIDYVGGPLSSRFQIGSEDAGSVLAELDILETIHGGELDISGVVEGEGADERTTMLLEIRNFEMRDAPLLARLLSATSPTGLGDVLQGKGVRFERLSATITLREGQTRIDDAMVFGSALGLTVSGTVSTKAREIDLEGVVIPIYELNEFISSIPVLGDIIAGGKGEGILAADYRISGSLDRPSITVNPLTVLTPGIFKPFVRAFGEAVERGGEEAASTESSIAPQDPGR